MDAADSGSPIGHRFLRYEDIGRGAMGTVYRGSDRNGDECAIKVLRSEYSDDPVIIARFVQERSLLVRLAGPGIVRVIDMVVEGDVLAIVMDRVNGGSLRQFASRRGGRLATAEAGRFAVDMLTGLAIAHGQGVVHRDIKPENILVDERTAPPSALVTDFGISGLTEGSGHTRMTSLVGTPEYMAPELMEGGTATPMVDVYSAGITLYEMLAGRTPFVGGTAMAVLKRHVDQSPERPGGLSDELWGIVSAMLAKDPKARPTAADAADSLRVINESEEQVAPVPVTGDFGTAGVQPDDADSELATIVRSSPSSRITAPESATTVGTPTRSHADIDLELIDQTIIRPRPTDIGTPAPAPVDAPIGSSQAEPRSGGSRKIWSVGLAAFIVIAVAAASLVITHPWSRGSSSSNVSLQQAVHNTTGASNYSEVLTEQTPQGNETAYLTYQAPDRLGGYIESGKKRSYVYVIGANQYQSVTTSSSASTKHLTFNRQQSQGAVAVDSAQSYLPLYKQGTHKKQSESTYTFSLTQGSQSGTLTYTVSGQYVSEFRAKVPQASIQLVISEVGASPPVALPSGATVVSAPSNTAG